MTLPRCPCGFVMPGPGHARDCAVFDADKVYAGPAAKVVELSEIRRRKQFDEAVTESDGGVAVRGERRIERLRELLSVVAESNGVALEINGQVAHLADFDDFAEAFGIPLNRDKSYYVGFEAGLEAALKILNLKAPK